MKKLFLMIFVLMGFVVSGFLFATAPGVYTDAIPEWDYMHGDTITTAYDTLSGDTDSSVLFENFVPEKGYEYIFVHSPFSGGSCDSLNVRLMVRGYDFSGTLICSTYVDTVTANDCSGSAYLIPFGSSTLFGNSFDIILETFDPGADPGNQVIINRCQLWRRRPIQYRKMWK